jgi:hypothetical protein
MRIAAMGTVEREVLYRRHTKRTRYKLERLCSEMDTV